MFNLGRLENIAESLGLRPSFILGVLDDFETNPTNLVKELTLWRSDPTKKPRDVISLQTPLRLVQNRIYTKLLLPQFRPLRCSHGGVRRRSPTTNARMHVGNTFAYVTDICGFYPAISCSRVNQLFLRQACTYDVARILTRLCTYDFHLALGLITSPILANEIFKPIDRRLVDACRKMGLVYSRFVDDITISGKFDIEDSGVASLVRDVIEQHGFALAKDKTKCGRLKGDIIVTGVRINGDHLDASKEFVLELERLLSDHASLAQDGRFDGPLFLEGELFGKALYACNLNSGRRRSILGKLKTIDWSAIMRNAISRNLCRTRDRLAPRGEPRPASLEPLPGRAGAEAVRRYYETTPVDNSVPPWE